MKNIANGSIRNLKGSEQRWTTTASDQRLESKHNDDRMKGISLAPCVKAFFTRCIFGILPRNH